MEGSESRQAFNCLLGEVFHTCVVAGQKTISSSLSLTVLQD